MSPRTPEQVHLMWLEAINAGDLESVMSLYEPEAAIVNPDGHLLGGLDAVRAVTEGLLSLGPRFELHVARVLQSGDLALLLSPWTLAGTADGVALTLAGSTTDVVRRQQDGTWRFIIDNPTGIAILETAADAKGERS